MRQQILVFTVPFVAAALFFSTAITRVQGDWGEIDNFQDSFPSHPYELDGNATNSNGWTGMHDNGDNPQIARIIDDPIGPSGGPNRVLEIGLSGDEVERDFHKVAVIDNNATGSFFFRFRLTGEEPTIGVGLDDQFGLSQQGQAGPWVNTTLLSGLQAVTADNDPDADTMESLTPLWKDTWYSVWMVIDNDAKEYEVHVQGGQFATQTQLTGTGPFVFRDSASVDSNLTYLYIRANADNDDGAGASVFVDDFYLNVEDPPDDLTLPGGVSLDFPVPVFEVDRLQGSITLKNLASPGSDLFIQGYSITSATGALNASAANWKSIANNYDSDSGGAVDSNDTWTILTGPEIDGSNDLSEFQVLPGDGGIVANGGSVLLSQGAGAWIPTPTEDLVAQVSLANGTILNVPVVYTGNGDETLLNSDLNHDGNVTGADWLIFQANDRSDLSGLSDAQRYARGDVFPVGVPDGVIDTFDFVQFKTDYEAANGGGSFAVMLQSVPEPSALFLLGVGAVGLAGRRMRSCFVSPRCASVGFWLIGLGCTAGLLFGGSQAYALGIEAYEGFDYDGDGQGAVMDGRNGGSGFEAAWGDGDGDFAIYTSGSLLYPSGSFLSGSEIGGRLHAVFPGNDGNTTGSAAQEGVRDIHLDDADDTLGWNRDNVTYMSVLVRKTTTDQSEFEDLTIAFDRGDTNIGGQIGISSNDKFYVGISTSTPVEGTKDAVAGTTYMLVAKFDSSTTVDDVLSLWVYEEGDTIPTSDPGSGAEISQTVGSGRSMERLRIRYGNFNTGAEVDEIRWASSWEAAVGAFGLTALIQPVTGEILLANRFAGSITFDSYQIDSPQAALRTVDGQWDSLSDQDYDANGSGTGENWDEAGGSNASSIAERFLLGSSTLDPGQWVSIGTAYDPGVGDANMILTVNDLTLGILQGHINFAKLGDMNDDGDVDEDDVPLFIQALVNRAAFEANPNATSLDADFIGDFDGNGLLDFGDLSLFSTEVNNASATASAVPEPTACLLFVLSVVGLSFRRDRRWAGGAGNM